MSGLTIQAIKEALSDSLAARIDRDVTVRPFRDPPATRPCITMEIADITYYLTFGSAGLAKLDLTLTLRLGNSDSDSQDIAMSDYLSGGTGNTSSIFDAINGNVDLGGLVDSCKCLEVLPPREDGDDYTAVFPVSILCKKVGAQA